MMVTHLHRPGCEKNNRRKVGGGFRSNIFLPPDRRGSFILVDKVIFFVHFSFFFRFFIYYSFVIWESFG